MVDMAAEYALVGPAIEEAVVRVLRSGQYVLGPETKALEEEVAAYVGAPFALGVGSGTEALLLALLAVGVGEGDEVITTAFTFFATIEAIRLIGAVPIFVDSRDGAWEGGTHAGGKLLYKGAVLNIDGEDGFSFGIVRTVPPADE